MDKGELCTGVNTRYLKSGQACEDRTPVYKESEEKWINWLHENKKLLCFNKHHQESEVRQRVYLKTLYVIRDLYLDYKELLQLYNE
jgi:hypothetical protein